ncbi:hypothetical protein BGX29_006037, partial [Mortierella sp. GBA35]
ATVPSTSSQHFRRQSFDLLGDGPSLNSSVSNSGVGHADKDLMGIEDLTSKITSETGKLASMRNQINNLGNTTGQTGIPREEFLALSAQKQDISIRLNQIKTLHESETKSIKGLESTLTSIQPQLIKLREEVAVSERELQAVRSNKDEFLLALSKGEEESAELKATIQRNNDNIAILRRDLESRVRVLGLDPSDFQGSSAIFTTTATIQSAPLSRGPQFFQDQGLPTLPPRSNPQYGEPVPVSTSRNPQDYGDPRESLSKPVQLQPWHLLAQQEAHPREQ